MGQYIFLFNKRKQYEKNTKTIYSLFTHIFCWVFCFTYNESYCGDSVMNISIFNYESPNQYLRDAWNKKRAFNKNFTIRAWSKQLGISSPGTFYQIIDGKRNLPKKYVKAISESLGLDAKESMYLETLIELGKAKTIEHKTYYKDRFKKLAPGEKFSFYELEAFHYLKDPLNGAIIELTCLSDFENDPFWIKNRLSVDASINEINKAIKLMLELKLLAFNDEGKLCRSNEHVYTKQDIKNEAIQAYHKNVLTLGADQLGKQEVDKREYGASAFGIKRNDLPKIKEQIRDFINDLINEYEAANGQAEEVYQLGIQFFGLTKEK